MAAETVRSKDSRLRIPINDAAQFPLFFKKITLQDYQALDPEKMQAAFDHFLATQMNADPTLAIIPALFSDTKIPQIHALRVGLLYRFGVGWDREYTLHLPQIANDFFMALPPDSTERKRYLETLQHFNPEVKVINEQLHLPIIQHDPDARESQEVAHPQDGFVVHIFREQGDPSIVHTKYTDLQHFR